MRPPVGRSGHGHGWIADVDERRGESEQGYASAALPGYLTLTRAVEAEIEAKRSRFLCRIERVAGEDEARAVVDAARGRWWDARHHCSAFIVGPPPGRVERSSDDGEPSGTAGRPMLEVLRGHRMGDVVAVVTRWFGGTLLGTGGLVRAYGQAVEAALAQAARLAAFVERAQRDEVVATLRTGEAGRVEHAVRAAGWQVRELAYGPERALLTVTFAPGEREQVAAALRAASGGAVSLRDGTRRWVDLG